MTGGDLRFQAAPPGLRRPTVQAAALLAGFVVVGGLLWGWLEGGGVEQIARHHGVWSALLLVPLQTLISLSFSPIPSDVVVFTMSLRYGLWLGAFFGWLGWMAGAVIQYELVRRATMGVDLEALRARLPERFARLPADHPVFLICGRWLPLGLHIVNTSAAVCAVSRTRFTLCAALGNAPIAFLVAALARGLVGSP